MMAVNATQNHRLLVTIDGPAGAGKSTAARLLASRLGYTYLDTGALYRAVAWQVHATGIDCSDVAQMDELLSALHLHITSSEEHMLVSVNSQDVTSHLRSPEISQLASSVAALPAVRKWLLPLQQRYAKSGGIVAEGRDMGTQVFPEAEVKFFLDADLQTRANRRYHDSMVRDQVNFQDVQQEVGYRDTQDRSRDIAPLKPASDAVIIDSSTLTIDQVVDTMMERFSA